MTGWYNVKNLVSKLNVLFWLLSKGVKALKDDDTLAKLGIKDGGVLYFKDLGTQIGWSTVAIFDSGS